MANYELLSEIEKYGRENKIPILLDESLDFITQKLNEIKPYRLLEIGTAIGFSAICFSKYLANGGRIDTIEEWDEPEIPNGEYEFSEETLSGIFNKSIEIDEEEW